LAPACSAWLAGFNYSEAMRESGKTWDPATLDTYLAHPREIVPGTKMAFGGLPVAADRSNVIAYLETLK
jgi:cytochrome c